MKAINLIKKNKLLFAVIWAYLILMVITPDMGVKSAKNSMYYVIEMLEIMPVIFILTSLIEAWVPREVIMNSFGEKSGAKGALFSFLLGSFSAGPIYAAFPVCKMLLKKGAKISNIVIILSTWAVIKIPMLANEAKFLGPKFMAIRWALTTVSIFIMAYLVAVIVKKEAIPLNNEKTSSGKKEKININEQYCIGCSLCARISPDNFTMNEKKAKFVNDKVTSHHNLTSIEEAIKKCPAKAISFE